MIKNTSNNKIYIGSTYKNFGDRRDSHMSFLRNHRHHNNDLQSDYDLYGKDSFVFEIIEEIESENPSDFFEREIFYIEQYNSFTDGYNKTFGGIGGNGTILSKDRIKKIIEINRKCMSGKKMNDETISNMRIAREKNKDRIILGSSGAILTEENVRDIKISLMSGKTIKELSKIYDVTVSCISSINRGRNWKSVIVDGWNEYLERNK